VCSDPECTDVHVKSTKKKNKRKMKEEKWESVKEKGNRRKKR
jgi:hypothetical protein